VSLFRPPTAITLSSSTGSATATEELRSVGLCPLGALTQLSGSYGCLGGSLDDVGPESESWASEEWRPKIQSTTA